MLTIVNTYWSQEPIQKSKIERHLSKFIPNRNVEVLLCIDNCDKSMKFYNYMTKYTKRKFKVIPLMYHGKAGGCRNEGLIHASNKYVFFIDSWNDSLDSGPGFNIDALERALTSFLSIKECDMYELSNYFNKFYRAHPWNIFYSTDFIRNHNLRFIEWQGYEDFLFNFTILKLNARLGMYLHQSQELLLYPSYEKFKCPRISTCYNHAFADTKIEYGIHDKEKYDEACEYFMNYLGYVPEEFKLEQFVVNANNEDLKNYILKQIKYVPTPCMFKYIFSNIEEKFSNPEHLIPVSVKKIENS